LKSLKEHQEIIFVSLRYLLYLRKK